MVLTLALATLTWLPKSGDIAVYKLVETAQTGGMTLTLDGTITETTTGVEAGRVTQTRDSTVYGEGLGQPRSLLPSHSKTVVYRPDGTLVDVVVENAVEDAFRSERLKTLTLPKAPIAVGGTWAVELPPDPNASNTGLKIVYTLVGDERVGGWDTWKIAARGGETEPSKAKVEATFWIDKATGARIRVHSKQTGMTFPGDDGRRVDSDEKLVRQP